MDGIFPGALYRPLWFTGKTGAFHHDPHGWILHVQVGVGSPWHYFQGLPIGRRKASTGWVSKDGTVEQYISAYDKPWAQAGGNAMYWAWETEGFPHEPLTKAQISALASIHNWHGTPDNILDNPGGWGIGTHSMGGSAWGGHECPGVIRAEQRYAIIATAQRLRRQPEASMTINESDAKTLADVYQTRYQVHPPGGGATVTRDAALGNVWSEVVALREEVHALRELLVKVEGRGTATS